MTLMTAPIRVLLPTLILTTTLALAACSDDNPTGPGALPHATSTQSGDLRLTVSTDKASYDFGESITITSVLTNTGSAAVTLDFARGNPARYSNFNFNANDDNGVNHYAYGQGTADQTTLGAGESIHYTSVWNQVSRRSRRPVERGVFQIISSVGFDNRDRIRADNLFVQLN